MFVIEEVKDTTSRTCVTEDLNGEEIVGTLEEQELQKKKKKRLFSIKNVTEKKDEKMYIKWKGYDNSFNSWIKKSDILQ